MRDLLVKWQVGSGHALNGGSWDPNPDLNEVIGGRLVTTCFALLTLEVYYRYPTVYKTEIPKDPEDKEVVAKPVEAPKAPKETVPDEKEAARTLDFALNRLASADNLNSKSKYDDATKKYESAIDDLKMIIAKFPESEEAKKAREELKKLKEQFEKIYKDRPNTDGGRQAGALLKKLKGD